MSSRYPPNTGLCSWTRLISENILTRVLVSIKVFLSYTRSVSSTVHYWFEISKVFTEFQYFERWKKAMLSGLFPTVGYFFNMYTLGNDFSSMELWIYFSQYCNSKTCVKQYGTRFIQLLLKILHSVEIIFFRNWGILWSVFFNWSKPFSH